METKFYHSMNMLGYIYGTLPIGEQDALAPPFEPRPIHTPQAK